jgi:hypothetical protein
LKKWFYIGLSVIISVGIFAALVGSELETVKDELARARYIYLLPCVLLLTAGLVTRAIRWYFLLDRRVSVWHCFHIINVGYFASSILPFRIGELARAWLATRLRPPVAGLTSISTIIVERLLDLLSVLAMFGFTLVLLEDVPREVTSAGAAIGVLALASGIGLAILAARPQWAFAVLRVVLRLAPPLKRLKPEARLGHFLDGIQPMAKPSIAISALFWSGVSWGLSIVAGYVMLMTLFDEPTWAATLAYIVFAAFSVALPAVPGNLGPFEGAIVGGLWVGGLVPAATAPDNAPALAFAAIMHALLLGFYIVFGLVGLWIEHSSVQQIRRGAKLLTEHESAIPAAAN